jgi:RsiW-degrading membrane proteinase PrsW (M82 family)
MGVETVYPLSLGIVLLSLAAAVVPTLIFVGLIYWVDRYEKEPVWLLAAAFLWGAVPSIIAAFILNAILSIPSYSLLGPEIGDVATAALIAPIVEESLKGLALVGILLIWRHEVDSILDGIIYAAMVGIGFAMAENVFYFLNVYAEGGLEAWSLNVFMRAVVFGLNHALFTSMMGIGIAIARLTPSLFVGTVALFVGWLMAVFLHFVHNLSAILGGLLLMVTLLNAWGGLLLMTLIIIWALLQERRWIRLYLADEVTRGTLSLAQYEIASSTRKRLGYQMGMLLSHGIGSYLNASRFYYRCSELAYKKHHYATLGKPKTEVLVQETRANVAQLSSLFS